MIIELPDSKQKVRLVILHTSNEDNPLARNARWTTVKVEDPDTKECIAKGESRCSPIDNFCKLTGRKLAYRRLVDNHIEKEENWLNGPEPLWSKADRRAIFQAVCPSFFKQKKNKKAIPGR